MCNVQIPTLIIMYVDRTHVYDRIIDVHQIRKMCYFGDIQDVFGDIP